MTVVRGTREYELKFKAQAGDLADFRRAVNRVFENSAPWETRNLANKYFDTLNRDLAENGIGVRLRRSGNKIFQTVKVKASESSPGGLMDRAEWECPVDSEALDFSILPEEARKHLEGFPEDDLQPIIQVDTERHAALLHHESRLGPELVVEAVADQGVVTVGNLSECFAECELELIQGDINSFLNVVADIHALCPLPMSNETKAARGYRLLNGSERSAKKAPKFRLSGEQTVDQALATIFGTCSGNLIDNEEVCLQGRDTEGVHQMRVSVRRLRSSLKIFRPLMGPAIFDWVANDLKWLGSQLGPARDWDVFVEETLVSMASAGIDETSIAVLGRRAEAKRRQAYEQVRETLTSTRYAQMVYRLTAFVALRGWLASPPEPEDPLLQPLQETAGKLLHGPFKKLMKSGKGLADQDVASRHRVRIRVKQLRYAVDFLGGVFPGDETERFIEILRQLQDEFGHINDLAEAIRLTEELTDLVDGEPANDQVMYAAGQVRGWYAHALQDVEPALLANWDAFAATPPFWKGKSKSKG